MAGPAGGLTAGQRRVVLAPADRHLVVRGRWGTGRTTALVERSLGLVAEHPALRLVVLCVDGGSAARFGDALLPRLGTASERVTISTVAAAARTRVEVERGPRRVLGASGRRRAVEALLRTEEPAAWGELSPMLGRPAFAAEVADALAHLAAGSTGAPAPGGTGHLAAGSLEDLASGDSGHLAAGGLGPASPGGDPLAPGRRWAVLQSFADHYRAHMAARGEVDWPLLLAEAAALYRGGPLPGEEIHVVVDDLSETSPLAAGVAAAICGQAAGSTVSGYWGPGEGPRDVGLCPDAEEVLGDELRRPEASYLVACRHPSLEAEAVAGELLAASAEGVAWSEMAVLVRNASARGSVIVRALARHGIPVVASPPSVAAAEPAVVALLDALRWTAGDDAALPRLVASPLLGLSPTDARQIVAALSHPTHPEPPGDRGGRAGWDDEGLMALDPRLLPLVELRRDLRAQADAATPAELAFEVWRRGLSHLAYEPSQGDGHARAAGTAGSAAAGAGGWASRGVHTGGGNPAGGTGAGTSALVAVLDGLARRAEEDPSERLADFVAGLDHHGLAALLEGPRPPTVGNAVRLTSISAAAGREWDTVVVAGCVEGELPRVPIRAPLLDPGILRGGDTGRASGEGGDPQSPGAADFRRRALVQERRLFELACSRSTRRLVAVAAAAPGVLVSRLVESWPRREARPLPPPGDLPVERHPTPEVVAVPEGRLRLSATQLETYDDCPLRYAVRYLLGVRDPGGVHAELGTLVHAVLAEFLDPAADPAPPRTLEALFAVAGRHWRDDIARYRPQVEEVRRDLFSMLEAWWESEGRTLDSDGVLAVERRFEVGVGPHQLAGSIDRVDLVAGSEGGVRVVDYKTGKREPRPADVAVNLQLAVYHLASTLDPELAAHGPARRLELRFLRSGSVYEQPVTPDHGAVTRQRVLERADLILAGDFTPSVTADCRTCSFHRLCPLQDQGREVGAA